MADTQDLIPAGWKLVPVEPTREMMEAMPGLPVIGAPGDMNLRQAGWSLAAILNRHRWLGALAAAPAAPVQPTPAARESLAPVLAETHKGMKVDYQGLIEGAAAALDAQRSAYMPFVLRELSRNLQELGRRYYAGDTAAVDEFLQLYCIEREARAAVEAARDTTGKEARDA